MKVFLLLLVWLAWIPAQAQEWSSLVEASRKYLEDVYAQTPESWQVLDTRTREDLALEAAARAAERERAVRGLGQDILAAKSLRTLNELEARRGSLFIGAGAFKVWLPEKASQVDMRIVRFHTVRARACAGELKGRDLIWADAILYPREARRLRQAWSTIDSEQENILPDRDPGKTAAARKAMHDLFWPPEQARTPGDPGLPAAREIVKRIRLDAESGGNRGTRFLEAILAKLIQSPQARIELADLDREFRLSGRALTVYMGDAAVFKGTRTFERGHKEKLLGGAEESADFDTGTAKVNPDFLNFQDSDKAILAAAASLAHEFEHLRLLAYVARVMPEHETAFKYDTFSNEELARLQGWSVALDLSALESEPTIETQALRRFADEPDSFWNSLMTYDTYKFALALSGLANPLGAYRKRRADLEAEKAKEEHARVKAWEGLWWAEHLTDVHGVRGLDSMRDDSAEYLEMAPADIQDTVRAEQEMDRELAYLSTPRGRREIMTRFLAAARDPRFRQLAASVAVQEDLLLRRLCLVELPSVKPTPGQVSADKFRELVWKDKRENGHGPHFWERPLRDWSFETIFGGD